MWAAQRDIKPTRCVLGDWSYRRSLQPCGNVLLVHGLGPAESENGDASVVLGQIDIVNATLDTMQRHSPEDPLPPLRAGVEKPDFPT